MDRRAEFPILSTMLGKRRLVYLDNAATTHKPACVLEVARHSRDRRTQAVAQKAPLHYVQYGAFARTSEVCKHSRRDNAP